VREGGNGGRDLPARGYQEADGALLELPGGLVGAGVAGRELALEDQLAQLLLVDAVELVEPLRPRVPLLHPRLAPPADLVPHSAATRSAGAGDETKPYLAAVTVDTYGIRQKGKAYALSQRARRGGVGWDFLKKFFSLLRSVVLEGGEGKGRAGRGEQKRRWAAHTARAASGSA
jgi:hypothetical protein